MADMDSLIPVAAFGLRNLIDAGAAWVARRNPGPSRAEQIEKRLKEIGELLKQEQASPKAASPPGDRSTGCVPCARAHLSTVSGTLKEALRFARSEGMGHPEVQTRLQAAEEDITLIERHDWTPEKILASPPEEAEIIREFLPRLRNLRQEVVDISTVDDLERAAASAARLATDFRLAVLKARGVDTVKVVELARRVDAGEMTLEEAKAELSGGR